MRNRIGLMAVSLVVAAVFILSAVRPNPDALTEPMGERRERILGELSQAIDEAIASGKYKCCIDPPCDMCFLGHWIWDDGSCMCDDMIAKGEFDKVCPQCVKGIELGLCKSTRQSTCEIDQ